MVDSILDIPPSNSDNGHKALRYANHKELQVICWDLIPFIKQNLAQIAPIIMCGWEGGIYHITGTLQFVPIMFYEVAVRGPSQ